MTMMILKVVSRSGREVVPGGLAIPASAKVADLKKAFHDEKPKYYPTRQRFTTLPPKDAGPKARGTPLVEGKSLADYNINDGDTIVFKDLGTQVPYKAVFFWEYFGPMAVYPLFYFFRKEIYGAMGVSEGLEAPMHMAQTLGMAFHTAHYAKRILETFFVHSFSHATMPIFNLVRNCSYYWGFAAFMSYFINHPQYTPVGETQMYIGFAISTIFQLANLKCHLILAALRGDGSKGYQMPTGFLFDYVTCANYTSEIYQWVGFNIATQSLMGYVFILCGAAQMTEWAAAKNKRLRQLFDGKDGRPKFKRPFIVLPPFL